MPFQYKIAGLVFHKDLAVIALPEAWFLKPEKEVPLNSPILPVARSSGLWHMSSTTQKLRALRRCGREAEGDGLLNRYRGNPIVGSNPTVSAKYFLRYNWFHLNIRYLSISFLSLSRCMERPKTRHARWWLWESQRPLGEYFAEFDAQTACRALLIELYRYKFPKALLSIFLNPRIVKGFI